MNNRYILSWLLLVLSLGLFSQNDSTKVIKLDTISLKVARINVEKGRIPLSVSTLDFRKQQDQLQQLSFSEYLSGIPGLFALNTNNFAQDIRVSIRGFGARSAFGIRGVKLLVDGIPETTPDGQGQVDNLNLAAIESIEVIRGSSATLYGNASGGIISISTQNDFEDNFLKAGSTLGSYHMQNFLLTAGLKLKNTNFIFQGNKLNTNGFREQSKFETNNLSLTFVHDFSESSRLNVKLNYTDSPTAEDPGGLTIDEVNIDRRQVRQRNRDFKTQEAIDQLKIGFSYTKQWKSTAINAYGFYSFRNFYGLLPFESGGVVDLNRDYFGNGVGLTFKNRIAKHPNKFQVGYDVAFQNDRRMRFMNLEGVQGDPTLNQMESFNSIGLFALDHFELGKFIIRMGIRYDRNNLEVEDRFFSDGNNSDKIILNTLNPSAGISYKINRHHGIFGNFSTSYETPALSELSANPSDEGGFNQDLKEQRASNYELGYTFRDKKHELSINAFYIKTKNDLVPFELESFPDRIFFRNAGSTNRKGLELTYNYQISKDLKANASYTFSSFQYGNYQTSSGNFNGNHLPGIPRHFGSISVKYLGKKGLNINVQNQFIGSLFANDANTIKVDSYSMTNINFSGKINVHKIDILPVAGINNIFNAKYNDNIRINAFGNRFYEPAPGINVFGGLKILF